MTINHLKINLSGLECHNTRSSFPMEIFLKVAVLDDKKISCKTSHLSIHRSLASHAGTGIPLKADNSSSLKEPSY
jgi:hypothetical protein